MPWPSPQDYNEAIQNPGTSFGDPELRPGYAVTNALGIPMPRSGNFADVYEFVGASGQRWAIKCFTREVADLQERYAAISKHLGQSKLPFMVEFGYLRRGVRVAGNFFPILKMRWVDGFLLNEFVCKNLDKPAVLEALGQVWLRMGRRLQESNTAHADLQHGNVILVPGKTGTSLSLKLIDYDGMWTPSLATGNSGELGHSAYQHPQRSQQGIYSFEVDRFPLLVVSCALRALTVLGPGLWERYENGDNLLFREGDFRKANVSPLLKELWQSTDVTLHDLVGHLTLACLRNLDQVPPVDQLVSDRGALPMTTAQEEQVTSVLGAGGSVQRQAVVVTMPRPTRASKHRLPIPARVRQSEDPAQFPVVQSFRSWRKVPFWSVGAVAAGLAIIVYLLVGSSDDQSYELKEALTLGTPRLLGGPFRAGDRFEFATPITNQFHGHPGHLKPQSIICRQWVQDKLDKKVRGFDDRSVGIDVLFTDGIFNLLQQIDSSSLSPGNYRYHVSLRDDQDVEFQSRQADFTLFTKPAVFSQALKVTRPQRKMGRYVGEEIEFTWRIGNEANEELLSETNWLGVCEQRLERDGKRLLSKTDKVEFGSVIAKDTSLHFAHRIKTKTFPPGQYVYLVDFKTNEGRSLQTQQIEFSLFSDPGDLKALKLGRPACIVPVHRTGDLIEFKTEVVNDSGRQLAPEKPLVATCRGWLEINGKKYALKSQMVDSEQLLKSGGKFLFEQNVDTKGYLAGPCRYHVECTDNQNLVQPNEELDFVLFTDPGTLARSLKLDKPKMKRGLYQIGDKIEMSCRLTNESEHKLVPEKDWLDACICRHWVITSEGKKELTAPKVNLVSLLEKGELSRYSKVSTPETTRLENVDMN